MATKKNGMFKKSKTLKQCKKEKKDKYKFKEAIFPNGFIDKKLKIYFNIFFANKLIIKIIRFL
jgi:hypothetical protein